MKMKIFKAKTRYTFSCNPYTSECWSLTQISLSKIITGTCKGLKIPSQTTRSLIKYTLSDISTFKKIQGFSGLNISNSLNLTFLTDSDDGTGNGKMTIIASKEKQTFVVSVTYFIQLEEIQTNEMMILLDTGYKQLPVTSTIPKKIKMISSKSCSSVSSKSVIEMIANDSGFRASSVKEDYTPFKTKNKTKENETVNGSIF